MKAAVDDDEEEDDESRANSVMYSLRSSSPSPSPSPLSLSEEMPRRGLHPPPSAER
jgi:hypothetical protein